MKATKVIYENGVYWPLEPVTLPEHTPVTRQPESAESSTSDDMAGVYEILSQRYHSGCHDTAERHNEHSARPVASEA